MKTTPIRNGFTLVEVLIVAVLGAVIVLAIYQTLTANVRTYSIQAERIQAQQVVRSGGDILSMELREVSPAEGDIVTMSDVGLTVRSASRFGLVCQITYGPNPTLTVRKYEEWFQDADTVEVFADNNVNIATDDGWISAVVTAVDTTSLCGTEPAQILTFAGQEAPFVADSVRSGALMRGLETRRYAKGTFDGDTYVIRTDESGATPMVGPVDPSGLTFKYFDVDGDATGVRDEVAQIVFQIERTGRTKSLGGKDLSLSRLLRVYPRN